MFLNLFDDYIFHPIINICNYPLSIWEILEYFLSHYQFSNILVILNHREVEQKLELQSLFDFQIIPFLLNSKKICVIAMRIEKEFHNSR